MGKDQFEFARIASPGRIVDYLTPRGRLKARAR